MRKTRERCRLGHAVALNDCIADAAPETLRVAFQSRTTGDESPEAPTEATMNVSEGPPVSQKVTAFGGGELSVGKSFVVCQFLAERFEYAWDCYDYVDALLLDDGDDLRWLVRFAEVHFGADQLRNKDGHHLSE